MRVLRLFHAARLTTVPFLIAALLLSVVPAYATPPVFHGSVDAANTSGAYVYVGSCGTGSIAAGQICTSSGAPTNNCAVGALALDTSAGNEYTCTAANTWSLHVIGSSMTSGNCAQASGTATITTASGPCAVTNADNNFSHSQSINAVSNNAQLKLSASSTSFLAQLLLYGAGIGATSNSLMVFNTTNATKPDSADEVGEIDFQDSGYSTAHTATVAKVWCDVVGATANDPGGACIIQTKRDGSGTFDEALVLTPGGHIFPNGAAIASSTYSGFTAGSCTGTDDQGSCSVTTPASCTAGTACGTVTINFGVPFYAPNGTTQQTPSCTYSVQDTNLNTNGWVAFPETVAYNQIIVAAAPMATQSVARTLTMVYRCNASSY